MARKIWSVDLRRDRALEVFEHLEEMGLEPKLHERVLTVEKMSKVVYAVVCDEPHDREEENHG
jgi:hypothetical protein